MNLTARIYTLSSTYQKQIQPLAKPFEQNYFVYQAAMMHPKKDKLMERL